MEDQNLKNLLMLILDIEKNSQKKMLKFTMNANLKKELKD